jgi:hypothetical protein
VKHRRRLFAPRNNPFADTKVVNRRAFLRTAAEVVIVAAGAGTAAGITNKQNKSSSGYGNMPYGGASR